MKKIFAALLLIATLAACTPQGVPGPSPDHGPPADTPQSIRIYLSVHDISNARAERRILGTAQAFGYDGKPISILNETTKQVEPAITPFSLRSVDGEAEARVKYFPNTAVLKVVVILQGRGKDSMLMEITDMADNIARSQGDGRDYCEIEKAIGTLGACTTYADVVVSI
jgi:hypothetical protein